MRVDRFLFGLYKSLPLHPQVPGAQAHTSRRAYLSRSPSSHTASLGRFPSYVARVSHPPGLAAQQGSSYVMLLRLFLVAAGLLIVVSATTCPTDGSGYSYSETVTGQTRAITYRACPNHAWKGTLGWLGFKGCVGRSALSVKIHTRLHFVNFLYYDISS